MKPFIFQIIFPVIALLIFSASEDSIAYDYPFNNTSNWGGTGLMEIPNARILEDGVVRLALEKENIESRPVWKPMHAQPVFQVAGRKAQGARRKAEDTKPNYKARVVGGEVAEDLFNRGLCLPSGTAMSENDLDRVINVILAIEKRK